MENCLIDKNMLKTLEDQLRCRICSEFYNNCVIAVCSHNFCSACIKKRLTTEDDCPNCFEIIRECDLRNNKLLDKLVRFYKKIQREQNSVNLEGRNQKAICQRSKDSEIQMVSVQSSVQETVNSSSSTASQSSPLINSLQSGLAEITYPVKLEVIECNESDMNDVVMSTNSAEDSNDTQTAALIRPDNNQLGAWNCERSVNSSYASDAYPEKSRISRLNKKTYSDLLSPTIVSVEEVERDKASNKKRKRSGTENCNVSSEQIGKINTRGSSEDKVNESQCKKCDLLLKKIDSVIEEQLGKDEEIAKLKQKVEFYRVKFKEYIAKSDEAEAAFECAIIGPSLSVPAGKLSLCRTKDYSKFTGDLLELAFESEQLAHCTLKHTAGNQKTLLDNDKIKDIQYYVSKKFNVNVRLVRSAIRLKLNTAYKSLKRNERENMPGDL